MTAVVDAPGGPDTLTPLTGPAMIAIAETRSDGDTPPGPTGTSSAPVHRPSASMWAGSDQSHVPLAFGDFARTRIWYGGMRTRENTPETS